MNVAKKYLEQVQVCSTVLDIESNTRKKTTFENQAEFTLKCHSCSSLMIEDDNFYILSHKDFGVRVFCCLECLHNYAVNEYQDI